MTSQGVELLSIGAIFGGPRYDVAWARAIRQLRRRVIAVRDQYSSPLNVNVIYEVPGNVTQPEFSGVRTGSFSKKNLHLIVQVAVPDHPKDDVNKEVYEFLIDAISEAESWAKSKKIANDLAGLRELIESL